MRDQPEVAPIFVKIDEYKEIVEVMSAIRQKLAEGRTLLQKIEEVKGQEEAELDQWRADLEEVQRKMSFIDKTLFDPEA